MTKAVVLRPRAHRDILETFAFLKAESPEAAVRFRNGVERVVRMLGAHPGMGSMRHAEICPELPAPLRFHPLAEFPRILVYYVERADSVEIVRIWDAARGLEALLIDPDDRFARELGPSYRRASRPASTAEYLLPG